MSNRIIQQIELLFKNANNLYHQKKYPELMQVLSQIQALIKTQPFFHADTATTFNKLARFYELMGKYQPALSFYQQALAIIKNIVGENSEATASSLEKIANSYEKMLRFEEALPLYLQALEIRTNILGINHPDTAMLLNNLAGLYSSMGRYKEALPLYLQAVQIFTNTLGINHPDTASSLSNLAGLYSSMGRHEEALPLFQQALEINTNILGINHPDTARSLNNLAELYKSMGRHEEALPLSQQALEINTNILGINHPNTATFLNNLAELYKSMGRHEEALPLSQQALEINTNILGINHPDTARSLNNLAGLYSSMGRNEEALPLFQQALEINTNILGINHPDTARSLNNLAGLYELMGRYDEALPPLQQALKINTNILGINHPDTATSLSNLGALYSSMARYEKALSFHLQALKIRKNILGINHPDTASSLNSLGVLYESMRSYKEALPLVQKALEIRINILGINHPDTVTSLNSLGKLYESMRRYKEASPLFQKALEIHKNILGINHPNTAISLHNLGFLYKSMGRYKEALPLVQQALEIHKNILGINHPDTASSLHNLAGLYDSMGRYKEALPLVQQALEIHKNILGINHPDTASSLHNLALLYSSMGRHEEALPLVQQALEIHKNILGINHPNTAISLNNLAGLYGSMGRHEEALPLYLQALEINTNILGTNNPDTANSLHNLGFLYKSMGRYKEALPLCLQALEICTNILGINHPNTAISLNNLALLYSSMGRHEEAYALMLQSSDIELKLLAQIFKISSERQRLTYCQQNYYKFEIFISLVFQSLSHSSEAIQSAFELIQKRKLIVTETSMLQKKYLLSGRYPHLEKLFQEYQAKIQQIITLTFQPFTEAQQKYRHQLIQEQQEMEQELSRQIPELNIEQKLLEIDRRAVASKLPEGSTLLEFVRFNVCDFKAIRANGDSQWKPARYLAFILPAGQPDDVQMIDLGEAENIDRLIKVFRERIRPKPSDGVSRLDEEILNTDNLDEVFENLPQLKQLLFDPIQKCLSEHTQKLIIAPDSELNLLPFELLPGNNHQYLMDDYTISYLNVGRDLIRLKFPSTTQSTQPLIIANPDYNLTDETAVTSQDTPTQTQRSIDTVYSDLHKSQPRGKFAPIPGTGLESVQVSQYLKVTPQTENNALKSLVKLQTSPRILHIATHGYFLTVEKLEEKSNNSKIQLGNLTISTLDNFHQAGMQNLQNPLARSGLAFAGANTALNGGRLPAAAEDGILTAQDVATFLDLSATELVVLSACESGLGEVKLGESVHGLRHAFLQTGAKSLIVSLWAVNDISTAILMGQFYHYYLEDKQPVGKALELAKRYVCNLTVGEMRDTWLTDEKIEYVGRYSEGMEDKLRILRNNSDDYQPYRHPKYWGAFIYLGLTD